MDADKLLKGIAILKALKANVVSITSVDEKEFSQTWLQLNVMEASKLGEVYVATKQLEFKFPIKEKDKLAVF